MNNKKFKLLGILVLALTMTFTLTACSDDDDGGSSAEKATVTIEGVYSADHAQDFEVDLGEEGVYTFAEGDYSEDDAELEATVTVPKDLTTIELLNYPKNTDQGDYTIAETSQTVGDEVVFSTAFNAQVETGEEFQTALDNQAADEITITAQISNADNSFAFDKNVRDLTINGQDNVLKGDLTLGNGETTVDVNLQALEITETLTVDVNKGDVNVSDSTLNNVSIDSVGSNSFNMSNSKAENVNVNESAQNASVNFFNSTSTNVKIDAPNTKVGMSKGSSADKVEANQPTEIVGENAENGVKEIDGEAKDQVNQKPNETVEESDQGDDGEEDEDTEDGEEEEDTEDGEEDGDTDSGTEQPIPNPAYFQITEEDEILPSQAIVGKVENDDFQDALGVPIENTGDVSDTQEIKVIAESIKSDGSTENVIITSKAISLDARASTDASITADYSQLFEEGNNIATISAIKIETKDDTRILNFDDKLTFYEYSSAGDADNALSGGYDKVELSTGVEVNDATVTEDQTLTVASGKTLTVASSKTLTVDDSKTLIVEGTLAGEGNLIGEGTLDLTSASFDGTKPTLDVNTVNLANETQLAQALNGSTSTINVASGTYGSIGIERDGVTLKGPNAGNTGYESREDEAVIDGPVYIENDNVTIDGFTINNEYANTSDALYNEDGKAAVQINTIGDSVGSSTANDTTIKNNILNSKNEDLMHSTYDVVLSVEGVDNLTIEGNHFNDEDDAKSAGIIIYESTVEMEVKNNKFEVYSGIDARYGDITADISGNEFIDTQAITVDDSSGELNITVKQNDFTKNEGSSLLDGLYVEGKADNLNLDDILNNNGNTFNPDGKVTNEGIEPTQ